jgi:hypothetical protein
MLHSYLSSPSTYVHKILSCISGDNAEVSQMSSRLTSESRVYADKARDLNRQVSAI